jgi:hypothetical protein
VRRAIVLASVAWLGLACASAPAGSAVRVADPEIAAFAARIDGFYRALEQRPLDSAATFEDPRLHAFFASPRDFSDWYASLANQVRDANLALGRAESVRVLEFRFDEPGVARVFVELSGHRGRRVLFRAVSIQRTEVWRQRDGTWLLSPEKL